MKSIAVVGSGISGLACGYLLQRGFDVTLFDRNDYAGGHTNTVAVPEDDRQIAIDTGFMVFNEVTYPNLTRLFAELSVATKPAPMSFGVQHRPAGIEYAGSSVSQLFAQRRNLVNPRYLRMLGQIQRFNTEAREALADQRFDRTTLQEYANLRGYGEDFLRLYLLPMSSAVWSTPFEEVRHFPAMTLLRFFDNHGLLGGLSGQHDWLTVVGGAKTYVQRMTQSFRRPIQLGNGVVRVRRMAGGAVVQLQDGSGRHFDHVIFACHADEALALLADPTADERRLLSAFRYQRNVATLHTDPTPMPRARRAWASWNVRIDGIPGSTDLRSSTIYWMNSLQGVSDRRDYFVSIDDPGVIDPTTVLKTIDYHHPLFNLGAIDAQRELPSLNQIAPGQSTYFCGSYFRYGFHEDALTSAIDVCRIIGGSSVWERPSVPSLAAVPSPPVPAQAASALYECRVVHERFSPKSHRFVYSLFAFSLDLDELDAVVSRIPWLSRNRFNLFSFFDRDHLELGHDSVRENVVEFLRQRGISEPVGRIQLITNLRILGYVFNPVSFFFCFDPDGAPLAAVAEVNNTFGETKAYLLARSDLRRGEAQHPVFESRQKKHFYISPFVDLGVDLRMRLAVPGDKLGITIDDLDGEQRILTAVMTGTRVPLNAIRLAWFTVKYPLLTLKVIAAIHWQAARLWLKGLQVHRKGDDLALQQGILRGPLHEAADVIDAGRGALLNHSTEDASHDRNAISGGSR